MEAKTIIQLLPDENAAEAEKFAAYCVSLATAVDKDTKELKNPWMKFRTEQQLADFFRRVKKEGLVFDGKHVTLQNTGISYDYVAYKNKMLIAYPESLIDVALVYEGDEFMVQKESGTVKYEHLIKDPFAQTEEKVVGGYCVIKNKRGEFLTVMSPEDIKKCRIVAKTDSFWKKWFKEMALKTVIKKACKFHFDDIYKEMEEDDNENYNLENPLDIEVDWKSEIDELKSVAELKAYYLKNKGRGKAFDQYVKIRKEQLLSNTSA